MAPEEDISRFLIDFKAKVDVYDVVYINREKNLQALADFRHSAF